MYFNKFECITNNIIVQLSLLYTITEIRQSWVPPRHICNFIPNMQYEMYVDSDGTFQTQSQHFHGSEAALYQQNSIQV